MMLRSVVGRRAVGAMVGRRAFHGARALRMAEPAEGAAAHVLLNLGSPAGNVYNEEPVALVNVPGMAGEYGIAASMAATISELKPGTIEVFKNEGDEPVKFFVPAGMVITHENSITDVAVADLVKLDELDASAAQSAYAEAKRTFESAEEGSREQAVAQIEMDVFEAVCTASGVSV